MVNQYYVKAIKELCDRHGAQLLLVSTPSPVNWSYERHNGIQKFADELGCDYVDLNLESLGIDWTKDTFDKGDHLNHFGSVKVTSFLADYLRDRGGLTDHRTDPAYSGWDQALKDYEARYPSNWHRKQRHLKKHPGFSTDTGKPGCFSFPDA